MYSGNFGVKLKFPPKEILDELNFKAPIKLHVNLNFDIKLFTVIVLRLQEYNSCIYLLACI